ncbi:hypothetical protein ACFRQM_51845, partial [Streptomyces sp. NPDC056831]|uniref:hypothetical protein n=1 Tax=Streptomyces sp. NPDC056831 TaxID=3345954 RepID=UPI0036B5F972
MPQQSSLGSQRQSPLPLVQVREQHSKSQGELAADFARYAHTKPTRWTPAKQRVDSLRLPWVENVYHRRVHSETGAAPLGRWMAGSPFAVPNPADLAEAFRWSE